MHNIRICKRPHNLNNCISAPYMGEELIAQTFTFAGALDESSDIYERNRRWYYLLRVVQVC
jgi:hypothetical protein